MKKLISCVKNESLRITLDFCAHSYRKGKTAQPWEASYQCKGCAFGAKNIGEKPQIELSHEGTCSSCRSKKSKLLYGGTLCVSCYNRVIEVFKGKNAKGDKPKKLTGVDIDGVTLVKSQRVVFAGKEGRLAWMMRPAYEVPTSQLKIL